MKIIDRYVSMGVFVTTALGVTVLSLVLVLGNIFKELLDKIINSNVPVEFLFSFIAFVLPFSLTFTIPWGFLTALLLVFGRMSADNELIALRANGVSMPRICGPVFILAAALTGICFWINVDVAPRAMTAMTDTLFRIATSNPAALFTSDDVVDQFPERRIYVGGREGEKLKNIIVFDLNEANEPIKMVHAKEGEITPDPANTRLILKLFNAHFEQRDDKTPRDVGLIRQGIVVSEVPFPISLEEFYKEKFTNRKLESYTLPELQKMYPETTGERRTEMAVEINKRFSVSLACFAFALIAVPLGITAHRKETSVGFAFSLIIAFTYFFFIIMANTFRGNAGAFPSLLIWVPNILFITLGGYLFWRLSRR